MKNTASTYCALLTDTFSHIPAPARSLRITVTVPARDEEASIARCLRALTAQRDMEGRSLESESLDVIVYANSCSDATAAVAAAIVATYPRHKAYVVANRLAHDKAHVGAARKGVMDFAAQRFVNAGMPRGLVASVDADTVVDTDWAAQMLLASNRVDAVAGHVFVPEFELEKLPASVRQLYALEATFRRLRAAVEAALDPLPEDPAPRHGTFFGASFAVAADTYLAAGGIPPLPRLEDREFMFALRRIDARVRFALRVRAATSSRRTPRVDGGFGTERNELYHCGVRGETFFVEHPAQILADVRGRAVLRRLWNGTAGPGDLEHAGELFGLSEQQLRQPLHSSLPFGTLYERVAASSTTDRLYAPVPVEAAIAALRAAISRPKTAFATRARAASGAG